MAVCKSSEADCNLAKAIEQIRKKQHSGLSYEYWQEINSRLSSWNFVDGMVCLLMADEEAAGCKFRRLNFQVRYLLHAACQILS